MITEKELFRIGFVRLGDNEDDPYYQIHFSEAAMGGWRLSGMICGDGLLELYQLPRRFKTAKEVTDLLTALGVGVNWDLTNRLRKELGQ